MHVEGLTAKYSCIEGHTLVGDGIIHCMESGWDIDIPACNGEYSCVGGHTLVVYCV